jgi:hypothetical protein
MTLSTHFVRRISPAKKRQNIWQGKALVAPVGRPGFQADLIDCTEV